MEWLRDTLWAEERGIAAGAKSTPQPPVSRGYQRAEGVYKLEDLAQEQAARGVWGNLSGSFLPGKRKKTFKIVNLLST